MTDEEISNRLSECALGDDCGAFAAGTIFGDWRITAFIAKGGTAEVYCAEHVVLGTAAALKVLSEPLTDSRKARFCREAKLLAELRSPSFPAFHGYGGANGRPYIAEELLEPGDLPTGDRQRAKYLLALCDGLKALHAKGVVHRDLKPANILFRKIGEPVIVDLGLAKSVDVPLVPDGVSIVDGKAVGVGTPEYAAPEQFMGGDITPAADVHALGVLAEKLLGGQTRLHKWRSGILSASGWWRIWGGGVLARAEWKKIIHRATSSIASERYQSVDAFATAIRRRHWLRNGIIACLSGLCTVGLIFVLAAILQMLTDPFTARFHYEGTDENGRKVYGIDLSELPKNVLVEDRVTLRGPVLYKITGPGILRANVDAVEDVEIEVRRGSFYNDTEVSLKDSSIKYMLKGNAYLTFSRLHNEDAPDKLIYDPEFNRVSFGFEKPE